MKNPTIPDAAEKFINWTSTDPNNCPKHTPIINDVPFTIARISKLHSKKVILYWKLTIFTCKTFFLDLSKIGQILSSRLKKLEKNT